GPALLWRLRAPALRGRQRERRTVERVAQRAEAGEVEHLLPVDGDRLVIGGRTPDGVLQMEADGRRRIERGLSRAAGVLKGEALLEREPVAGERRADEELRRRVEGTARGEDLRGDDSRATEEPRGPVEGGVRDFGERRVERGLDFRRRGVGRHTRAGEHGQREWSDERAEPSCSADQ